MRHFARILVAGVCIAALALPTTAQPPGGKPADDPGKEKSKDYSNSSIVTKMMAFDKNKDGKLTKDEVTDTRLHRLFDLADANKDGVVTKEELMALAAKMEAEMAQGRGRGPGGPGGPGGFGPGGPGGPPGGFGPADPGGPGGFGGPPQPGQVMPSLLQDMLKLTADQKKQLEELQKDVDSRLAKILTDDQKKQLKEMRERGPGGFGPPGGRGGPGGPPGGEGGRGRRGGDKPPE
jgi:hypothetical protein